MGIPDTYKVVFNGYVALVRAMNGGTTQHLTNEQDKAAAPVMPTRDSRQYVTVPRPSGPQYNGRHARSHCKNDR